MECVESVMLHGFCNTSGSGFLYGLIEERLWLGIARRIELRVRLRTVRDFSDSGVGARRLVCALAACRHATYSSMVGLRFRFGIVRRGHQLDLCRAARLRRHADAAGPAGHAPVRRIPGAVHRVGRLPAGAFLRRAWNAHNAGDAGSMGVGRMAARHDLHRLSMVDLGLCAQ